MATKRKRADEKDTDAPPAKKRTDGIRILSVNACGFDKLKWDSLEGMADEHDVDIVTIQEGRASKDVHKIVDKKKWSILIDQETPTDLTLNGQSACMEKGTFRYYNTFVRKGADITVSSVPYEPTQSASLRTELGADVPAATTSRGRVTKKCLAADKLRWLGLGRPQKLTVKKAGRQALRMFSFHAPQGGGSGGEGYSGMDAKFGHEVLSCVVTDDNAPHKLIIGDQNAKAPQMRKHYPNLNILSAGPSDQLTHAAASKGLSAEKIDLGDKGKAFCNKGTPGCSDHLPMAISITVPNET